MAECLNRTRNLKKCSCTYEPCERKGNCCECIAFHRGIGELPGCLFSKAGEATYDRSPAMFRKQPFNG